MKESVEDKQIQDLKKKRNQALKNAQRQQRKMDFGKEVIVKSSFWTQVALDYEKQIMRIELIKKYICLEHWKDYYFNMYWKTKRKIYERKAIEFEEKLKEKLSEVGGFYLMRRIDETEIERVNIDWITY